MGLDEKYTNMPHFNINIIVHSETIWLTGHTSAKTHLGKSADDGFEDVYLMVTIQEILSSYILHFCKNWPLK